ncbi:MAG: MFS transporter [Clostridiales bacterium]|nr:MFS transporter [Clostridiales bacterium]MDD6936653.1 MFS transporter [Clostridiales bacterium]MDY2961690.1 MFS transporter [Oscillospiraceae bacterium]
MITIAGSMIYGLPYFRSYYYDAYLEAYNLTNTQMGMFGTMFGIFGMISYLFGGVVADMISPRKLMSISLVLTGLGGLLHLMHPSYGMLLFIYMLWGFTSLFAFWPSLLKALRQLAGPDEQSKATGFMDGGRGIVNAIHLAVTLAIFNYFSKKASELAGLNGVIIFYSAVVILLGILLFFLMKEETQLEKAQKFNFKEVISVLKLPAVWILSLVLCCTYTMNIMFYYFTPYSTSVLGVAATGAAMVTMLAQYIRPLGCFTGGIAADRLGRSKVMYCTFTVMAICTAILAFAGGMSVPLFVVLCVVIYFAMYAGYSLVFSMLPEGGVPEKAAGTAIGLVCTLGYLPEVFCPVVTGKVLDTLGDAGYKPLFIGIMVIMIVGIGSLILWDNYIKRLKAKKAEAPVIEESAEA